MIDESLAEQFRRDADPAHQIREVGATLHRSMHLYHGEQQKLLAALARIERLLDSIRTTLWLVALAVSVGVGVLIHHFP